jgi:RimJ/RimL family protein N-acetyltransferase
MMMRRFLPLNSQHLVYRHRALAAAPEAPPHLERQRISHENLASLFGEDPERHRTFARFLKQDMHGYVLCREGVWTTYGWLRPPGRPAPPHLPDWLRHLDVFWIFFCRTKEEYRGRGFYKLMLAHLVAAAQVEAAGLDAGIYIDTDSGNLPARRAIQASGFTPQGIIRAARYRIPKTATIVRGSWNPTAPHPTIDAADRAEPAIRRD